jgi:hypothetical protein
MAVIPYYVERHTQQKGTYRIVLLLDNGGKSCMDIESISEFLENNDIVPKGASWGEAEIQYVPIDTSKTDMSGFYNWTDLPYTDTRECLRAFIKIPGLILSNDSHRFDSYLEAILRHINI